MSPRTVSNLLPRLFSVPVLTVANMHRVHNELAQKYTPLTIAKTQLETELAHYKVSLSLLSSSPHSLLTVSQYTREDPLGVWDTLHPDDKKRALDFEVCSSLFAQLTAS